VSNPQTFLWLPQHKEAFCAPQDLEREGSLSFREEAILGNPMRGMARTVSLTSDQDLSGIEITCEGTLNGVRVSETLQGPNNNTLETTQLFDRVSRISVSDAVQNLSAGTGTKGRTGWVLFDYQRSFPSLAVQVNLLKGTATYSLVGTLTDVASKTDGEIPLFPIGDPAMTDQTETALTRVVLTPLRYVCVTLKESDEDASLEVTFLQQGVI
jgi:hypothetical protein